MSSDQPSSLQRFLTWAALILAGGLLILGIVLHGFSIEVQERFWTDIADRIHGPMTFRFILQPVMAFLAALPDGLDDARHGHSAFAWTKPEDESLRRGRLKQTLTSTARVVLLGMSMDVIYQLRVFDTFYPAEALMMAVLLALIPYFIFRWLIERVAIWFPKRGRSGK